jgi:IS5 family transposase
LLHGEEVTVRGGSAYSSRPDVEELEERGVRLITPKKTPVGGKLTQRQKNKNRKLCSKRAPVEHPFHIVKCLFGYRKVRYRGLFKNRMHQLTLFMLANLFKVRRSLRAA